MTARLRTAALRADQNAANARPAAGTDSSANRGVVGGPSSLWQELARRPQESGQAGAPPASRTTPSGGGDSGQPLDADQRRFFEGRLGQDLGDVRLHRSADAAAAATALNARAITVGAHIAFGPGQYRPEALAGRQLLAHELAHVIQQRGGGGSRGESSTPGDRDPSTAGVKALQRRDLEREAGQVARDITGDPADRPASTGPVVGSLRPAPVGVYCENGPEGGESPPAPSPGPAPAPAQGGTPPTGGSRLAGGVAASPYSTVLPGYSQLGDTCGAASLVSALAIWDREHWNPAQPNARLVQACNLILTELDRRGPAAVDRWARRPAPAIRQLCAGDAECPRQAYEIIRGRFITELQQARDRGRRPGATFPEADYQRLGMALYFLWDENPGGGLSSLEIERIQRSLGLATTTSGNVQSFDELFTHDIVKGLQPDQIAQAAWFVNNGQQHAFLIGRLQTGEWFLSDQGPRPAAEFRAASRTALQTTVRAAAASGGYWLFVGTVQDYMARFHGIPGWTGIKLLGGHDATLTAAQNVVPPRRFLAEIDAGTLTWGQRLERGDYQVQAYSLADAQGALMVGGRGALIVEQPTGVFTRYTTNPVSAANVTQTTLDVPDSRGGFLVGRTVQHAWLRLSTASGQTGNWFQVF